MTCYDVGGVTKIHVQSNGLPDHCYYTPKGQPTAVEVDYTANWMSAATLTDTNNPNTQASLNDLICDFSVSVPDKIPASAGYVNNAAKDVMNSGWGIAVSGVMIFNGIGGSGVDAFYPAVFVN